MKIPKKFVEVLLKICIEILKILKKVNSKNKEKGDKTNETTNDIP